MWLWPSWCRWARTTSPATGPDHALLDLLVRSPPTLFVPLQRELRRCELHFANRHGALQVGHPLHLRDPLEDPQLGAVEPQVGLGRLQGELVGLQLLRGNVAACEQLLARLQVVLRPLVLVLGDLQGLVHLAAGQGVLAIEILLLGHAGRLVGRLRGDRRRPRVRPRSTADRVPFRDSTNRGGPGSRRAAHRCPPRPRRGSAAQ